ncbi:hypothetical protein A2697_01215 [Candidatus Curtissbacteria bacterium RIFCSPHIGHO2_01_FULL_41_44]|nr:MAG: hypothetical protein A2697_01215 [Candidatus Curtissbacteria bacterium RIFCSPHIGHO2_01_FULL_41_44]OGD97913.1 MAG: hypothetical protein A3E71_03690 [Candidatus Curtissbacteria bacterium RIFCSPHIGHO2_12_FULL_42_33]OGE11165.1 MAG: hypothetical protein A3H87_01335 [Candidatus Curtissbacteria bacterium RIFCSPLOWO2_02_FULL_42_37]
MRVVNHAWFFDVDGVITDLQMKKTDPKIFAELIKRLEKGEPVVLITGRSLDWTTKNVLKFLISLVPDEKLLDRLIVSAEFGGVLLKFQNGEKDIFIDRKLVAPKNVLEKFKEIVENDFYDSMVFEDDKLVIATAEKRDNYPLKAFREAQTGLVDKLRQLMDVEKVHGFEVHADSIGTNIRHKNANKSTATKKILKWLAQKNISVSNFVVIGDSLFDLEIGLKLQAENLDFKFVFVGDRKMIKEQNLPFPLTFTQNLYEKGTLEYLTSHQTSKT